MFVLAAVRAKPPHCQNRVRLGGWHAEKGTQLQDNSESFFYFYIKRISKSISTHSAFFLIKRKMKAETRVNIMTPRFLYNFFGIFVFCTLEYWVERKSILPDLFINKIQ